MDKQKSLGQFFTPRSIADLMVSLVEHESGAKILEPSAGTGVFVDSLSHSGHDDVTAWEIDPHLAENHPGVEVADFLAAAPDDAFDVIIGNPPYVRWRNVPIEIKQHLLTHPNWRDRLNGLSDLLYPFIIKAVEALKPGGELILITPSFWLTAAHAAAVRKVLTENGALRNVILFGERQVFEGVSTNAVIFRFVKGAEKWPVSVIRLPGKGRLSSNDLADLQSAFRGQPTASVEFFRSPHPRGDAPWHLMSAAQAETVEVVEAACTDRGLVRTLGEVASIANGMVSGLDAAFRLNADEYVPLGELDGTLCAVRASSLRRLAPEATARYIYLNHVATEHDAEIKYPTLYKRLLPYRESLDARYQYDRRIPWWHWVFPRNEKALRDAGAKIVVPCKERFDRRGHVRFAVVPAGTLIVQDTTAVIPKAGLREDIRYLTAWLSSKAVFAWLQAKGRLRGGVLEFSEAPLAAIPVRLIDWDDPDEQTAHDRIVTVVALAEQGRMPIEKALKVAEQEFTKLLEPNRQLKARVMATDGVGNARNAQL
jgi:adenine-specific DNA-methyltransferase